jgi:hypothetical protein
VGGAIRPLPGLAALWVGLAWVLTLGWPLAGQGVGPLTAWLAPGAAGIGAALAVFAQAVAAGLALVWLLGGALVLLGRRRIATPAE